MAIYLITYDLNKETKRPDILSEVKTKDWVKLSESSYAIDTTETVAAVYNRLAKHIDADDCLYVIPLKKPCFGFGYMVVNDWLDARLPS